SSTFVWLTTRTLLAATTEGAVRLQPETVAADKSPDELRRCPGSRRLRGSRRRAVGAAQAVGAGAPAPDPDGRRADRRRDRRETRHLTEDDAQPPPRAPDEDARPDADARGSHRLPPRPARGRAPGTRGRPQRAGVLTSRR